MLTQTPGVCGVCVCVLLTMDRRGLRCLLMKRQRETAEKLTCFDVSLSTLDAGLRTVNAERKKWKENQDLCPKIQLSRMPAENTDTHHKQRETIKQRGKTREKETGYSGCKSSLRARWVRPLRSPSMINFSFDQTSPTRSSIKGEPGFL